MNLQDDEQNAYQALESGNYEDAVRILKPMADRDSSYALLSLGWIYDSGKIGNRNTELAAHYYSKAASLGHSAGSFELGRLRYEEGRLDESRALFADGGKSGNIQCQAWHGLMMAKGEGGEKNLDEASIILRLAASKGQLVAKRALYTIELNSTDSVIARISIYLKILLLSVVTVYETLKNPYSDRGYR
jgi:TPR repeat protein